jgi:Icc-related predicted phosphoesterase
MNLKIAIVTDIHHGKDSASKKGESALTLMAAFASFVADNKPDLVLDLGDRISDMDPETDLELEREVNAAFVPIRELAPVFHICGNSEQRSSYRSEACFC